MKPATLLTILLAVTVAAVASLPAGPAPLQPAEATAAECHWKRHAKRVVKHVRRHGRLRKVVRWKPRWTCVPQAPAPIAPPPSPAPVPASPPPAAPPAPEPEAEANRLAVKSAEYHFVLSRPSVRAGAVTIELNNRGEDPHNLNLRPEGADGVPMEIPETQSLQRNVATFELAAGKYRLWCSLPEHEERGMYTSLVVD